MNLITWLPGQDNYIKGSFGEVKFYIKVKVIPSNLHTTKIIVDSLYFINPTTTTKYLPQTPQEQEISQIKLKAEEFLVNFNKLMSEPTETKGSRVKKILK